MDNGMMSSSKILPSPKSGRYSPGFFSRRFIVFIFKTMTHFELILCVVSGLNPITPAPLTKKAICPPLDCFYSFAKN